MDFCCLYEHIIVFHAILQICIFAKTNVREDTYDSVRPCFGLTTHIYLFLVFNHDSKESHNLDYDLRPPKNKDIIAFNLFKLSFIPLSIGGATMVSLYLVNFSATGIVD